MTKTKIDTKDKLLQFRVMMNGLGEITGASVVIRTLSELRKLRARNIVKITPDARRAMEQCLGGEFYSHDPYDISYHPRILLIDTDGSWCSYPNRKEGNSDLSNEICATSFKKAIEKYKKKNNRDRAQGA